MHKLFSNQSATLTDILPSHPRPDSNRVLDASLLDFDLPTVIERIKQEPAWIYGKHNAITLTKSERMSIVLIAMHNGSEIKMQQVEGTMSLHIIKGKIKFTTENESVIIHEDKLLVMHKNIKHSLFAIEETIFLLTTVSPFDFGKSVN